MDEVLPSYMSIEKLDGDAIRKRITNLVKKIKRDFQLYHEEFKEFNSQLAYELNAKWSIEVKRGKGAETPKKRVERMKLMTKKYRLELISQLTNRWYDEFWRLRSDVSLITAFYHMSGLTDSPLLNQDWKPRSKEFAPIVLRMKGPRKPTKKNFKKNDIKYDLKKAIHEMLLPLEDWVNATLISINKLKGVGKRQSLKVKRSRFRESYYTREYLTVLCQAVSPRQPVISNGKENNNI